MSDKPSGSDIESTQESETPMLGNEFKATYGDKDLKQKIHATIGSGQIIAEKIDGAINRNVNAIVEESGHEMRTLKAGPLNSLFFRFE